MKASRLLLGVVGGACAVGWFLCHQPSTQPPPDQETKVAKDPALWTPPPLSTSEILDTVAPAGVNPDQALLDELVKRGRPALDAMAAVLQEASPNQHAALLGLQRMRDASPDPALREAADHALRNVFPLHLKIEQLESDYETQQRAAQYKQPLPGQNWVTFTYKPYSSNTTGWLEADVHDVDELVSLLDERNPAAHHTVMERIAALGPRLGQDLTRALIQRAQDERRAGDGIPCLAMADSQAAVPLIMEKVLSPNRNFHDASLQALPYLDEAASRRAVDAFLPWLEDPARRVPALEALDALSFWAEKAAIPVAKLLADPASRQAAEETLKHMHYQADAAADVLQALAAGGDPETKAAAGRVLQVLNPGSNPDAQP